MVGDLSFVSTGECGPSLARSCSSGFLELGALSSHLILIGISRSGECSRTVESGTVVVVMVAVIVGLRIGTKADFTTSICSSSESSDDECDEWSFVELSSMDELILWLGVDWLFEGGLEVELREETGESRAPFDCSICVGSCGSVRRAP